MNEVINLPKSYFLDGLKMLEKLLQKNTKLKEDHVKNIFSKDLLIDLVIQSSIKVQDFKLLPELDKI